MANCAMREMIQITKNSQAHAPTAIAPDNPSIHKTKKITKASQSISTSFKNLLYSFG
jgi:hypothetical protein